MAEVGVLNRLAARGQASPARRQGLLALLVLLVVSLSSAQAAGTISGLDELPPAEQYRQLNLALMVAEGIEPAFLDFLLAQPGGDEPGSAPDDAFPLIDVDAFQTPLNRIVDQSAMVRRAAVVFRYEQLHHAAILDAIESLVAAEPAAAASIDLVSLAEDAIIVRTALSGSMEYLPGSTVAPVNGYLKKYQGSTLYLRNVMEFWDFNQELAELTEQAMDDAGGRMAAYQRMVEDEPESDTFTHHLQAVEQIYWQSRNGKGKAPKIPGNEFIEQEAQVD